MSQSTVDGLTSLKATRLKQLQRCNAPEAYLNLNECERKCEKIVESLQSELNPHFKDWLFLQPSNEYGAKKFVCTYIKATLLPELNTMTRCAQFLARHIIYEPLVEGATTIVSPSQTLDWAVGDCMDCSFLLASLLIGAGYDAFVVYGRAPDWIRRKDQSHQKAVVSEGMDIVIQDNNFAQKPSGGGGTHSWILVKAGSRNVEEHSFIEPSTGILYPLCQSPYSQVSFICNVDNCWLNVGNDNDSIQEVVNFASSKDSWRQVLPINSVPSTWTNAINLPSETLLLRYAPDAKRVISLDKAKVKLFGANADSQGVVCRVIRYDDTAQTIPVEVTELLCPSRREDTMIQRTRRPFLNMHHAYFSIKIRERFHHAGKTDCIKFREFTRVDGLVEREEVIGENGSVITERFLHRADGLTRRLINISLLQKDDKKKPRSSDLFPSHGVSQAVIERIAEHYEAPEEISRMKKSVACRSFLLKEGKVRISYYDHEVLRSEEEYIKDHFTKEDLLGKEFLLLESAVVSTVKRTQIEMIKIMNSFESSSPLGNSDVQPQSNDSVARASGKSQADMTHQPHTTTHKCISPTLSSCLSKAL